MGAAWGTVPDWIAAGSTFGAFGFTGWLLWLTHKDRQQAARREIEAQAALVTAWMASEVDATNRVLKRPVIRVRNASEAPVYDVAVLVDEIERRQLRVVPPDAEPALVRLPDELYASDALPSVEVEFTDARGSRWRRESNGGLTLLQASG